MLKSNTEIFLEELKKQTIDTVHSSEGHISSEFGFLPPEEPKKALIGEYHTYWDTYANNLANEIENGTIVKNVELMPILPADSATLPNEYLLRASLVIKSLVHAYYFIKTTHDNIKKDEIVLPKSLEIPWQEISKRLGRTLVGRNVTDDFLYNWKLKNSSHPRTLHNMELMVPYFNEQAERRMTLVVIAMEAAFGNAVGAIARAQTAILNKDDNKLKEELQNIIKALQKVCQVLYKLNPKEFSKNHVDPVLWGRTFGRISGGWYKGEKGNSGAQLPMFHAMDAFIGRTLYQGKAAEEIQGHYASLPENHRKFIVKINECQNLKDYIFAQNDKVLENLYVIVLEKYCGEYGVLGFHRHKIFGIINLSIFDGRNQTNNVSGATQDTDPKKLPLYIDLDEKLKIAIEERMFDQPKRWIEATISSVDDYKITIDSPEYSFLANPGDHIEFLPTNHQLLIDKIIELLDLNADSDVALSKLWKTALESRDIKEDKLKLKDFLKYAQIRLIDTKMFNKIRDNYLDENYKNVVLQSIISEILKTSDNKSINTPASIEFIEFIEWCSNKQKNSYINALKNIFSSENLSKIFLPMLARLYSITYIEPSSLCITVGAIEYRSFVNSQKRLFGTASSFLLNASKGDQVRIRIKPAYHFNLPDKAERPIILFAAGTGISPFIEFVRARIKNKGYGKIILIISIRADKFYYEKFLTDLATSKKLEFHIILTNPQQAKIISYTDNGMIEEKQDSVQHINDFLEKDIILDKLAHLIFSKHAHVYVCGSSGFADAVRSKIDTHIFRDKYKVYNKYYEKKSIFFTRRYHEDIYDSNIEEKEQLLFYPADLKRYNILENGIYIILNKKVYDIKKFLNKHPGGLKILQKYAGLDASYDFQRIGHNLQPDINNELMRCYKGKVYQININPNNYVYKILNQLTENLTYLENNVYDGTHFFNLYVYIGINNQSLNNALSNFKNIIDDTINSITKLVSNNIFLSKLIKPIHDMTLGKDYAEIITLSEELKYIKNGNNDILTRNFYIDYHNEVTINVMFYINKIKQALIKFIILFEKEEVNPHVLNKESNKAIRQIKGNLYGFIENIKKYNQLFNEKEISRKQAEENLSKRASRSSLRNSAGLMLRDIQRSDRAESLKNSVKPILIRSSSLTSFSRVSQPHFKKAYLSLKKTFPVSRVIPINQINQAVTFFKGDGSLVNLSHLDFSTWYHPDVCHYLLQLINNKAQCVRVLFHDDRDDNNTRTFKSQLESLIVLGNHLNKPVVFICKEPGAANHFIVGLVEANNILLINPLGMKYHPDCYRTLAELQQARTINQLWLSSTSLQRQEYEPEGLVSCGPISLELAMHIISHFSLEQLHVWEKNLLTKEPNHHQVLDLTFHDISIEDLLPDSLKALLDATYKKDYEQAICAIRQQHLQTLTLLPAQLAEAAGISVDNYLATCKEAAPAQAVFNALLFQEKTIINITALKEYQLLEQELNKPQNRNKDLENLVSNKTEHISRSYRVIKSYWLIDTKNKKAVISNILDNLASLSIEKYPKNNLNIFQLKAKAEESLKIRFEQKSLKNGGIAKGYIIAFNISPDECIKFFESKQYEEIKNKIIDVKVYVRDQVLGIKLDELSESKFIFSLINRNFAFNEPNEQNSSTKISQNII